MTEIENSGIHVDRKFAVASHKKQFEAKGVEFVEPGQELSVVPELANNPFFTKLSARARNILAYWAVTTKPFNDGDPDEFADLYLVPEMYLLCTSSCIPILFYI